jgi:hypothetical protein
MSDEVVRRFPMACALAAFFALMGAAPHTDEILYLTVKGHVNCSHACGATSIVLSGTRLGDPSAEREVGRTEIGVSGGSFVVSASILIGTIGEPVVPPADREVALEVLASSCTPLKRKLLIRQFSRDKHGYIVDVGSLHLTCRK